MTPKRGRSCTKQLTFIGQSAKIQAIATPPTGQTFVLARFRVSVNTEQDSNHTVFAMARTTFDLASHLSSLPKIHSDTVARPKSRMRDITRRTLLTQDDVHKACAALKKSVIGMVWIELHNTALLDVLDSPDIKDRYVVIPLPQIILENSGMRLFVLTYDRLLNKTLERVKYRLRQESTIF